MKDECLVVATANGAGVFVWKLRDVMAGNVSRIVTIVYLLKLMICRLLPFTLLPLTSQPPFSMFFQTHQPIIWED